jgi:hypothetical protein
VKLTAYAFSANPLTLRAAPVTRAWMDALPERHAYRCLPLSIANAHGWEILSPCAFDVTWDGGPKTFNLKLSATDGSPALASFAVSHFASGIVTFQLGYLFRTEAGWNLYATGPTNRPKDGIAPLSGVIETDWLPYPFTMNWQMTRPGTVRFEKDEPVCLVFPVARRTLAETEPELRNLDDDAELKAQAMAWMERRVDFMKRYQARDPATVREAWERYYFVGRLPDGGEAPTDHVSKLRLPDPVDRRVAAAKPDVEARSQRSAAKAG